MVVMYWTESGEVLAALLLLLVLLLPLFFFFNGGEVEVRPSGR